MCVCAGVPECVREPMYVCMRMYVCADVYDVRHTLIALLPVLLYPTLWWLCKELTETYTECCSWGLLLFGKVSFI